MKKLIVLCLSACLGMGLLPQQLHAQEAEPKQQSAQNSQDLAPSAKAAYLVENTTGKVIYAKHETDKLYPASMTKMIGLLLIFEALHDKKITWEDSVSASEYAASMGGSQVFLEPGEAIALNAGYLVTEVMDIVENGLSVLILDASAACHMPDVLEMPYRPPLKDSGNAGEKAFTYRLSSCTCLAGDVIGDYSFDKQIHVGDKLYFQDMAIYSMVKNNTFNGIPLPGIAVMKEDGDCELIRTFGYGDFKGRLA